jgi:hypothetical protein
MPASDIPQDFRKSPEALVSYNWEDIRDGTGYAVFYGGSCAGTTLTSPNIFYSGMIHKNGTETTLTNADTYYECLDVNFDITFNRPMTVFGNILTTVPFGIKNTSVSDVVFVMKATLLVYHYDGVTETQIGATQTSEEPAKNMVANALLSHITTLKTSITSVVNFKRGETLRFTIKVYAKCEAAGKSVIAGVGCDPMNRTDAIIYLLDAGGAYEYDEVQVIETNDPTQLKLQVPFRQNN